MCCAATTVYVYMGRTKKSVSGYGKRRGGGQGAPCPNYETPRIREMQVCVHGFFCESANAPLGAFLANIKL